MNVLGIERRLRARGQVNLMAWLLSPLYGDFTSRTLLETSKGSIWALGAWKGPNLARRRVSDHSMVTECMH